MAAGPNLSQAGQAGRRLQSSRGSGQTCEAACDICEAEKKHNDRRIFPRGFGPTSV
jgi:hypothetical protein